jgi:glycosyltransferase involved in cell wall biosynthesis
VRLSAWLGAFIPVVNRSGLFFFFPFFHTGGAERVHADIVNCFYAKKPWIVFTKKSSSREFYSLFDQGASLFNFWPICKYLYPFSVGLAAGFINRHKQPVVFGANSLFYALLLPFLKPHVRCSDLIHAFGGGVETFTLPAVPKLDSRVVINQQTRHDLILQYAEAGLDAALAERIMLITNRVSVPSAIPCKQWNGSLQMLFVGRGSEEKRVHLIGRTARRCRQEGLQIKFTIVGAGVDSLESGDEVNCTVSGHITDASVLSEMYAAAHLIVIVSSREGFPLTVMEGMAQGCVPVCTAVGGIPEHIRHAENGWLLPAQDDDAVVTALYEAIVQMYEDRKLLERLAVAAYGYAQAQFGGDRFCELYHKVIQG